MAHRGRKNKHMMRMSVAVVALMAALACAGGPGGTDAAAAPDASGASVQTTQDITHLVPVRDSVGPQPTRFAWSAVDGAESYLLRIWNEVDVRIASEAGLTDTSIDFPADAALPAGTYFWAVVAFQNDRPIAESGLSAFVVTTD